MIKISSKVHYGKGMQSVFFTTYCLVFMFVAVWATPILYAAENSLALTVTPPLFQVSLTPGEEWSSMVKVVNGNSYDIRVFASVMNFKATGEGGRGSFEPLPDTEGVDSVYSLGNWIHVSDEGVVIPREQSALIPFTVKVPEFAEPGGHYASILVGTAPERNGANSTVMISSKISSLIFVRVAGDVHEEGRIREFSTSQTFYQEPRIPFTLRFENTGNVHLLPQGDITIYNMWGKQRGIIPINHKTDFGNVLPDSTRRFSFKWVGKDGEYEMGYYRAVATLSYGDTEHQNVYQTVYFWVVPFKLACAVLGGGLITILFFIWVVRRYIRRALLLETERLMMKKDADNIPSEEHKVEPVPSLEVITRPLVMGTIDLRNIRLSSLGADEVQRETLTLTQFIKKYKMFLISLLIFGAGIYGVITYFGHVLEYERDFDAVIMKDDGNMIMISPDNVSDHTISQ